MGAPKKNTIAIVETNNLKNKLKIDPRITNCILKATMIENIESFFVSLKNASNALKIGKEYEQTYERFAEKLPGTEPCR